MNVQGEILDAFFSIMLFVPRTTHSVRIDKNCSLFNLSSAELEQTSYHNFIALNRLSTPRLQLLRTLVLPN